MSSGTGPELGISVVSTEGGHEVSITVGITADQLVYSLARIVPAGATLRQFVGDEESPEITLVFDSAKSARRPAGT